MSLLSKKIVRLIGASMMLALASFAATAQSRADTIKLISPYSAGGIGDTLARRLADVMRQQTSKTVVVENIGGAGGTIGAAALARAKPDGRTLMLAATSALTIGPGMNTVAYDPKRDLVAIQSVAAVPIALLATTSAPFGDFQGLLAYARANPGAVRYGTPGQGSNVHLLMASLQQQTGIDMVHIPYKGSAPAVQDALGAVFELLVTNTPETLVHVQAGKLRPLAVAEPQRLAAWPTTPTLNESGLTDMVYRSDFGLFTPAGLSDETRRMISAMTAAAASSALFMATLERLSLLPGAAAGTAYAQTIFAEHDRNAAIIKALGIGR